MAKTVSRINGRNGEGMWVDEGELLFRTGGRVCRMKVEDVRTLDVVNAEQARTLVADSELVPHGAWTAETGPTKGKSDFVVATSDDELWVLEVTKKQSENALAFVRGIKPPEKPQAEDFKLYAAIQTPMGALFTVGSILCVFLAVFFVYTVQMPIPGLIVAILGIIMFTRIK